MTKRHHATTESSPCLFACDQIGDTIHCKGQVGESNLYCDFHYTGVRFALPDSLLQRLDIDLKTEARNAKNQQEILEIINRQLDRYAKIIAELIALI